MLESPWLRILLAALAVWRITHLLAREDGPGDLVVRLRRAVGDGFWGGLLDCFYCLSLWIALPFAFWIGAGWGERGLLWPALSGAAILLDAGARASHEPLIIEARSEHELLRREEERTDHPEDVGTDRRPTGPAGPAGPAERFAG